MEKRRTGEHSILYRQLVWIVDNGGFCTVEEVGKALNKHDLSPLITPYIKPNISVFQCSDSLYLELQAEHLRYGTKTISGGTKNGYIRLMVYLFELIKGYYLNTDTQID